jgi:CheY-like chemotaxis protein
MKKINCVLLVDDNPDDNELHRNTINKAMACNVVNVASNGEMALDYLKKSGDVAYSKSHPVPDVIYLDLNMPGMNGFEFLECYKKLDQKMKAKAVIIMLSVSLNPDDEKKVESFNEVTEYNYKPLTVDMLRESVERVL